MRKLPILTAFMLFPALATANDDLPFTAQGACMEGPMAQFGRYVGNWDIEDSRRLPDGSGWVPGNASRWDFVCLGNGVAVQDFWMPDDGTVGTNLRTWNADEARWDIAWAVNGQPGFAHIVAEAQPDGRVVMHYESPLPDPLRRITFFPPDASGWNWTLEVSTDDGESWFEVYRIRATPAD